MQFRHEARQALGRAKAQLDLNDDQAVRYAALELRLTLEAIVYDRLQDYRRDVPPDVYDTWQPPKVLRFLLEIDPRADQPRTVTVTRRGEPSEREVAATAFFEKPIDQATLRANYDALGSYLHMPTLKQTKEKGGISFKKLRQRCELLVDALDPIVTPAKASFVFGSFSHCPCFRCGADMRKRFEPGQVGKLQASCVVCGAEHFVIFEADGDASWTTNSFSAFCPQNGCDGVHRVFPDEIREGFRWACEKCNRNNVFELCAVPEEPASIPSQP